MANAITNISSREFNQNTGEAKRAASNGPVCITDRGKPAYVLLSFDYYQQLLNNQSNLIEMLSNTPGVGDIDLQITQLDEIAQPFIFS